MSEKAETKMVEECIAKIYIFIVEHKMLRRTEFKVHILDECSLNIFMF